ncbi:hypothetical protein H4R99_007564 [Coemansia sp. RSA 1722]|nr:hypothetical protein LPJ57_003470 [Coemansia sp. RSA 486]KAJ2224850.1 hypothetical protein IWW45_008002 [Coemansia sp. RSA 485]KAJ2589152.1 hypothetical protein H4R99_007564 [Coemansia sp. RSA 1722]
MNQSSGLVGFYQNAHGVSSTSQNNTSIELYFAAAENDNLGWDLAQRQLDPMYTMNRRNEEKNEASRDSFFKRLKTRTDTDKEQQKSGKQDMVDREQSRADTAPAVELPKKAVVFNGMRFGFGMMKLAQQSKTDSTSEKISGESAKHKALSEDKDKKSSKSSDFDSEKKSKKDKKDKKDKKRKHK